MGKVLRRRRRLSLWVVADRRKIDASAVMTYSLLDPGRVIDDEPSHVNGMYQAVQFVAFYIS